MEPIFQHYQDKGLLRLHQMAPPVEMSDTVDSVKVASPASLNHCMYSNMYRYKYMLAIDLDEILVPRMHGSYNEMLQAVNTRHGIEDSWPSYSFTNVYHFLDFSPDQSQSLRTLRYRTRLGPSSDVAPKSFVDPRRCVSVFNHYCLVRPVATVREFTVIVDPAVASTNHYRWCKNTRVQACLHRFNQGYRDDHMLQYREELVGRVNQTLKAIGETVLPSVGKNCQSTGLSTICL
jgi:hypothetical protein